MDDIKDTLLEVGEETTKAVLHGILVPLVKKLIKEKVPSPFKEMMLPYVDEGAKFLTGLIEQINPKD